VEREVIFAEDLEKVFGKRQWTSRTEEIIEAQKKQDADNALAATNSEKTLEEKKNLILPETSETEEEKATEKAEVEEEKAEERKEKTENQ